MVAVPFLAIQDNLEASSEDERFVLDGLVYEIDGYYNTVDVVGPEEGWDQPELEVPSSVIHGDKEYRVTGIDSRAFENMTCLESASLSETVSDIGTRAFAGCTSLVDINIPHAVTSLRETFIGCTSLESVMLTGSYYVTELHGTFEGCTGLKDVAVRWTAVVGDRTFAGCTSLTNLDFGNIHSVGDCAFEGCISLERLDFGTILDSIGDNAFAGCTSIVSVDVPRTEGTIIGDNAFAGCTSLTSVHIGENVTSVGDGAFSGCASISMLTFLSETGDVGTDAFSGCDGLRTAHIRSFEVLSILDLGGPLTILTLGGNVTEVSEGTLPSLASLETLVLEEGVTTIGPNAFTGSHGLELIAVPDSMRSVDANAFDVDGICHVAGSDGILDDAGVSDPVYGLLVTYEITGRPDVADHLGYGWALAGEEVACEPESVDGCTVTASIDGSDVKGLFTMPDSDVLVRFIYDDGERIMLYYDDNVLIEFIRVHVGDPVPNPSPLPRPVMDDYRYEFMGWDGYEPGMTVSGSMSFSSEFRVVLTGDSGAEVVEGVLSYDDGLDKPLYITADMARALLTKNVDEGLSGVSFSFENGWMTIGNDDLSLISDEGLDLGIVDLTLFPRYLVIVEGPEGVSVDVDLIWLGSKQITVPIYYDEDGNPSDVEGDSVWHDGRQYVRFNVDETGTYSLDSRDTWYEQHQEALAVMIPVLIVAVLLVAYYISERRSERGGDGAA